MSFSSNPSMSVHAEVAAAGELAEGDFACKALSMSASVATARNTCGRRRTARRQAATRPRQARECERMSCFLRGGGGGSHALAQFLRSGPFRPASRPTSLALCGAWWYVCSRAGAASSLEVRSSRWPARIQLKLTRRSKDCATRPTSQSGRATARRAAAASSKSAAELVEPAATRDRETPTQRR